jgi:hypothetical protein
MFSLDSFIAILLRYEAEEKNKLLGGVEFWY